MDSQEIKNTRNVAIAILFLLGLLYVINPPAQAPLGIYIVLIFIATLVYSLKQYQPSLIGVSSKNIRLCIILALSIGGVYYFATKLIPGFSLGLPLMPQAISDSLKWFIVVIVAPIVETIVFQGALMGYVKSYSTSRKQLIIAIFVQAFVFSLFHLAAYISGFYSLPSFTAGLSAISANLSAFLAAFIFALIAGFVVVQDGIKNLTFVAILHFMLNLIIYTTLAISFALTLPLT